VKDGARLSGAGRCLFKVCPGKNKLPWSQAWVTGLVLVFGCARAFGGFAAGAGFARGFLRAFG